MLAVGGWRFPSDSPGHESRGTPLPRSGRPKRMNFDARADERVETVRDDVRTDDARAVTRGAGRSAIPKPLSHAQARAIFIGLMLAVFLAALNQTIVATALPTIGRAFGDFENLSWVVTAYLLTSTAVAPLFGKLSDIHGRRATIL